VESGSPGDIRFTVRAAKAAPRTVLEMEIWDSTKKAAHKQSRSLQNFAAGETKNFDFTWTPTTPGQYWINLGIYGPKFAPNYSWSEHL
jgi:hypothetical protein